MSQPPEATTEDVPCALIRLHGEVLGPYTFPQLRAWVERGDIPAYIPARHADKKEFVALRALPEWKINPEDIDRSAPPINQAAVVTQRKISSGFKIVLATMLLLSILIALGGYFGFVGMKKMYFEQHEATFVEVMDQFWAGKYAETQAGLADLERVLVSFEPEMMAKVNTYQALAHLELGDAASALSEFEATPQIKRVKPRDLNLALAGAAMIKEDHERAEEMLRIHVIANPNDFAGRYLQAENLRMQDGDRAKSLEALDLYKALAVDYPGVVVRRRLGETYFARKDYKNAIPILENLSGVQSDDDQLFYHLGLSYLEMNQGEIAMKHFARAKELNPDLGVFIGGK